MPNTFNIQSEAHRATRGALIMGASQFANVIISLVFTFLIPRLLGVLDFGNLIYFQAIVSLMSTLSMLGMSETMSRYYPDYQTRGLIDEASRLFNSTLLFRLGLGVLTAAVGILLLLHAGRPSLDLHVGYWLFLSILLRNLTGTLAILLYVVRQISRVSILLLLQGVMNPVFILLAYRHGGFSVVPAAMVSADLIVMITAWTLSRTHVRWQHGLFSFRRYLPLLRFGGLSATGSIGTQIYSQLTIYLFGLLPMSPAALSFFGLASRTSDLISSTLLGVSGALFPSLVAVQARKGMNRAVRWLNLLARIQLPIILFGAGLFFWSGPFLIRLMWGEKYIPAYPCISIGILIGGMTILATKYRQIQLLAEKPALFVGAIPIMYAGFGLAFLPLTRLWGASGAMLAVLVGSSLLALAAGWITRTFIRQAFPLHQLWGALIAFALCLPTLAYPAMQRHWIISLTSWIILFAALTCLSRDLRLYEIREIFAHAMQFRTRSNQGESPK